MAYIGRDGTVGGRKSTMKVITDFIYGIINFVALFFSAITNPPQTIESHATVSKFFIDCVSFPTLLSLKLCFVFSRKWGARNQGRSHRGGGNSRGSGGGNIRQIRKLGDAQARIGGG